MACMAKVKTCKKCGMTDESSHFDYGRLTCTPCRIQEKQISTSATYEAYLLHLFVNARSKVSHGQRTRTLAFTITHADLVTLWQLQEGKCAISGVFLTHHKDGSGAKDFNASIDRISNAKDYTPDNIQLVAYRINLMKHTLSEDLFYWWIKTIHDSSCD